MSFTIILLLVGFFLLVKGADYLVDGSSSIAKHFGISDLVIGLTIVAFGTSAPELLINVFASLSGSSEIALGNVIGSNTSNILLILGVSAIIYPLSIGRGTAWKEIPLNFLAVIAVFLLINDDLFSSTHPSFITRSDGIILLLFFIIFIYYTFGLMEVQNENSSIEKIEKKPIPISIIKAIGGMVTLAIGGQFVVTNATIIASSFGISESLIGLTIVALGGSAPELATSAMAAYRKNADIAIGNVVGSNLFNLFWVLGLSAIIAPIPHNEYVNTDLALLAIATLFLFLFCFTGKKQKHLIVTEKAHTLTRIEGVIFVLAYVTYIIFLIYRG